MEATAYLVNRKELEQKLEKIKNVPKKKSIIRKASRESARQMYQTIKADSPRRSGIMQKSVKLRAAKRSRVRVGVNVVIRRKDLKKYIEKFHARAAKRKRRVRGYQETYARSKSEKNYFYPAIVHYGSKHMKGNPWIKRITDAFGSYVLRDFSNRIIKLVNAEVGIPTQKTLFDKFK